MTLSIAQVRGNRYNTYYPYVIEISDLLLFEAWTLADNCGAVFEGNQRSLKNFKYADCVLMDCDNDEIDAPELWLTPAKLSERLRGVMFGIVHSKSDMKDKDKGQKGISTARPRFHVYFPLSETVRNPERIRELKEILLRVVPEFDSGAKDAARFFYGVENPRCEMYDGEKCIDEYLREIGNVEEVTRHVQVVPTSKQPPARKERPAKRKRKTYRDKLKCEVEHETYSELKASERLQKLMPYRPDCMISLKGTPSPKTIRLWRSSAILHCEYVQMNPRAYYSFMVLDIDYEMSGADFWKCLGLAAPYFVVMNPDNNRGHVIYALRHPVYTRDFGNYGALKYLHSLVKAYTEIAHADKSYSGHLAKNPWSRAWRVVQTSKNVYDMRGLVTDSVRVAMEQKPTKKARESVAGLGRNCYIFEHVRIWAYRAIREYWGKAENLGAWYTAVKAECERLNAGFTPCLPACEIRSLARSIAMWTWKHLTPAGFANAQRASVTQRWSKESRKGEGIILLNAGFSVAEICEILNVRHSAVYNWRSELPYMARESVSEIQPWLDMGISRATWYRLQSRK
ncbi:MAG: replication initiation protein [Synergistaceae bacterium]|nr:replication initiation protein [Synergistaceae bacterium]